MSYDSPKSVGFDFESLLADDLAFARYPDALSKEERAMLAAMEAAIKRAQSQTANTVVS